MNQSNNSGNFYLYQEPASGPQNILPLAWRVSYCAPGINAAFQWEEETFFTWCRQKEYDVNQNFFPDQILAAKPGAAAVYTKQGAGYRLIPIEKISKTSARGFSVSSDGSIVAGETMVGIGMFKYPALAVRAEPNTQYFFTEDISYFIGFGNCNQGQILEGISGVIPAKVSISERQPNLLVQLQTDHTWRQRSLD